MGRVGLPRDFDLSPMGIIGWLMILVQTILLIIFFLRLKKRQVPFCKFGLKWNE